LNKLEWGLVALFLVLAGVTVYSFTQIIVLQSQVKSLQQEVEDSRTRALYGKTVTIGFIASSTIAYDSAKLFLEQIVAPDMNAYCKQLGKNVQFQFQIEDAQGLALTHLEKVQGFKSMGIDVFIGGLWTSQATGSLNYVNSNHMLMWSPSSVHSTYALVDRLYRLSPSDSYTAPALVEMMWSYGIKHVVFLQRGDSWGDDIMKVFKSAWKAKGGDFTGNTIRYNATASEFSTYLADADLQITDVLTKGYKHEEIGGVLLSFNEAPIIIAQAEKYPNIYRIKWFGADSTARSQMIIDQSSEGATRMKIFSLLPSVSVTRQYQVLESRYTALTGLPLGSLNANIYDTSMIIMKAMLQADSHRADDIVNLIPILCDDYYGVSGSCSLNEFGDRLPPPYDIWGYGVVNGKVEFVRYGGVDPVTGNVSWFLGGTPDQ
jgi:branched-chain amino acid transport system substrate-binding protein